MLARSIVPLCVIVSILLLKLFSMLSADALSMVIVGLVGLATVASWLAGMWWSVSTTSRSRFRQ